MEHLRPLVMRAHTIIALRTMLMLLMFIKPSDC